MKIVSNGIEMEITGGGSEYSAGDGIDISNDTINVTNPVHPVMTQNEYDGLSEEEKKNGLHIVDDGDGVAFVESNIYSEEETIIGRWIDGRPLYRKCIPIQNILKDTIIYTFPTPIDVNELSGIATNGLRATVPLQYLVNGAGLYCYCSPNKMDVGIVTIGGFELVSGVVVVKYTKTTDPPITRLPAIQSDSIILTPNLTPSKAGKVEVDGVEYDYEMPDSSFALASASASSANFGFSYASATHAQFNLE